MKKERRKARHFDDQFRLSVLKDYYESGASYGQISRKYDVSSGNIISWERKYMNKCVPLPSDIQELEKQVFMAKRTRESISSRALSAEEKLREETRVCARHLSIPSSATRRCTKCLRSVVNNTASTC